MFSYSAGHGLLLLRSRKTNLYSTRIDVLVQDVRAMELCTWFEGLEIVEVGPEYLRKSRSNPIEMVEPGNRIYAMNGAEWHGFVVGGVISVHEDEDDYMAPSKLLDNR